MPELAEVETVRRQLEEHLRGRKIVSADVDPHDRYLYRFAPAAQVKRALTGAKVKGTGRKGKYFWLELDRKPWPLIHLGMSGNVAIVGPATRAHSKIWGGAKLWSERDRDLEDRLAFCRLLLHAGKGVEVALLDPRRFGRLWLCDDPWTHPRVARLGWDPLLDFPTAAELARALTKRKAPIKSVLLDQAVFAGVGNWLADEILYQARVAPAHLAANLTVAQVRALRTQTLRVCQRAVDVHADYERFPKDWLFHARWGKGRDARTARGEKIEFAEIGGRTTAWVPTRQR